MTHLLIRPLEFPMVIPEDAKVGDTIHIAVTGIIRRIEGDLVDTSGYAVPSSVISATEVEIHVQRADRHTPSLTFERD